MCALKRTLGTNSPDYCTHETEPPTQPMALLYVYGDPQEKQKVKVTGLMETPEGAADRVKESNDKRLPCSAGAFQPADQALQHGAHPLDFNDTLHSGLASSTRGSRNLLERGNKGKC